MKRAALVLLALGAAGGAARAQTYQPELEADPFVLTSDAHSVALTESASPLDKGSMAFGLDLRVGGPPLDICVQQQNGDCTQQGALVGTRVATDLTAAIGFGRFGVHLQLPVILHQSSDFDPTMGSSRLGAAGIGDLRLGGKAWLVRAGAVTLGWDLTAALPTGGGANFIGDGGMSIENRAIGEYASGAISLDASFGYDWRQHASELANLYVNDELVWSAAGAYAINAKLSAGAALFGRIGVIADPNQMGTSSQEERPVEAMVSGRYQVAPMWQVEVGAGRALDAGYGAPPFRVLAALRYVRSKPVEKAAPPPPPPPAPKDTDGDGLTDDVDKCPNDPEDKDGFEDDDGCPDPDNDGDGIPDVSDKCPMDAEDKDGFQDDDGCPDADNDADGIPDVSDKCPNDAEDKDGFQDDDGCPDPDNDADGIPDVSDKCPNDAEVYNGVDDTDGCPDAGKPLVTVTTNAVEINEEIYFDTDKATIKKKSHKILDVVASAIVGNPTMHVRVEGYTDDTGTDEHNQTLSEERAKAVLDYLVGKGVPAERLESAGFGNTKPKVSSSSSKARAKNRRVEFVIVNSADSTTTPPSTQP